MRSPRLPWIFLLVILMAACGRSSVVSGQYEASYGEGGREKTIVLELREGGQGSWTADGESIAFKWDVRGGEVLLHTKAGGVIRVAVNGEELTTDLPGVGKLVFRRPGS
ncbi:hypothetical protein ASZ90_001937 [hydrocarbon metagenome]|uniref:DUF5640 domain-containing protein n=1 Tax=hydrocarbon metagenome TaxID=938273 RepID=A0A0W8G4V2_9ZZZZ